MILLNPPWQSTSGRWRVWYFVVHFQKATQNVAVFWLITQRHAGWASRETPDSR